MKLEFQTNVEEDEDQTDSEGSGDGFALQLSIISEVPTSCEDPDAIHVVEDEEEEDEEEEDEEPDKVTYFQPNLTEELKKVRGNSFLKGLVYIYVF